MMVEEIRAHLTDCIIPFWKKLRDDEHGGYYGYMDYDLHSMSIRCLHCRCPIRLQQDFLSDGLRSCLQKQGADRNPEILQRPESR